MAAGHRAGESIERYGPAAADWTCGVASVLLYCAALLHSIGAIMDHSTGRSYSIELSYSTLLFYTTICCAVPHCTALMYRIVLPAALHT